MKVPPPLVFKKGRPRLKLREYDQGRFSGYCKTLNRYFYHLMGTVATVDREYDDVKIWPREEIHVGSGWTEGKLWFKLGTLRCAGHQRQMWTWSEHLARIRAGIKTNGKAE